MTPILLTLGLLLLALVAGLTDWRRACGRLSRTVHDFRNRKEN